MVYNLELAKFLESIIDDLARRGEKKQIPDSLLKFYKYVKESVMQNSFGVVKLNELHAKCKEDLYHKLYQNGYLFFESTAKRQQFFNRLYLLTVAIGRMKMIARHYNDVVNQKIKPEDFLDIFKKHNPVYVVVPNAIQRKADPRLPISFEQRGDGQYLAIRIEGQFIVLRL